LQKKARTEEAAQMAETKDGTADAFPEPSGCLMIFGGLEAYGDKRRLKLASREVNAADPAVPTYLWS